MTEFPEECTNVSKAAPELNQNLFLWNNRSGENLSAMGANEFSLKTRAIAFPLLNCCVIRFYLSNRNMEFELDCYMMLFQ